MTDQEVKRYVQRVTRLIDPDAPWGWEKERMLWLIKGFAKYGRPWRIGRKKTACG